MTVGRYTHCHTKREHLEYGPATRPIAPKHVTTWLTAGANANFYTTFAMNILKCITANTNEILIIIVVSNNIPNFAQFCCPELVCYMFEISEILICLHCSFPSKYS